MDNREKKSAGRSTSMDMSEVESNNTYELLRSAWSYNITNALGLIQLPFLRFDVVEVVVTISSNAWKLCSIHSSASESMANVLNACTGCGCIAWNHPGQWKWKSIYRNQTTFCVHTMYAAQYIDVAYVLVHAQYIVALIRFAQLDFLLHRICIFSGPFTKTGIASAICRSSSNLNLKSIWAKMKMPLKRFLHKVICDKSR